MQVYRNLDHLPAFRNAVITIGTFDGVHTGHQKVIDALLKKATEVDGESIIITFHPHPRKIIQPEVSLQLINTLDEKISLLQDKGINHLVIVPFTETFANQTAEEYLEHFIIQKFSPDTIIIGYDHHFGKQRKGNFQLLEEHKEKWNYRLVEIPKYLLDEIAISSTKIRTALLESDVSTANRLLGYSFFFEGKVVEGDKIGRTLGFPTANLEYTDIDKVHLGEGVYAVTIEIDNRAMKGMLSIGKRPTLNDNEERVEVNIINYSGDLYNRLLKVTVHTFLRQQVKYTTLEELKAQLHIDQKNTLAALKN